jgi:hypothetical protein
MAYTIPVPESTLHAFLIDHLPSSTEQPEVSFTSGRVIVSGRVRFAGVRLRLLVEFEPSASEPDVLTWRIRSIRPFLVRWLLRLGVLRLGSSVSQPTRPWEIHIRLDELLSELPAWKRLPASVRSVLRLQHWWMPSNGRGAFLVFKKDAASVAPLPQGARPAAEYLGEGNSAHR